MWYGAKFKQRQEFLEKNISMQKNKERGRQWVMILVLLKQMKAFEWGFKELKEMYRKAHQREMEALRIQRFFFRKVMKYGTIEEVRQNRSIKK